MRFYLDTNIKFKKGYNYGKEEIIYHQPRGACTP